MKPSLSICILCLSTALPALAADANEDEGGQPHTHANELQERQPIGKPGNEASFDRTIEVTITETSSGYMLFDPDAIHIGKGSVVRFVIKKDVCIMAFLGLHDLSRRIFQSAAI